jgi:hypothetical protein
MSRRPIAVLRGNGKEAPVVPGDEEDTSVAVERGKRSFADEQKMPVADVEIELGDRAVEKLSG